MSEKQSESFEVKLTRLEGIVKKLELPVVGLDESVELFREGKVLAAECEALLRDAEVAVSVLASDEGTK